MEAQNKKHSEALADIAAKMAAAATSPIPTPAAPPNKRRHQKRKQQEVVQTPSLRREQPDSSQHPRQKPAWARPHHCRCGTNCQQSEPGATTPRTGARRPPPPRIAQLNTHLGAVNKTTTQPPDTGAVDCTQWRRRQCGLSQQLQEETRHPT